MWEHIFSILLYVGCFLIDEKHDSKASNEQHILNIVFTVFLVFFLSGFLANI